MQEEKRNWKRRKTPYHKARIRILWLTISVLGVIIIGATILTASGENVGWLFG